MRLLHSSNLQEVQLHRSLSAEHRYENSDLASLIVHFGNLAFELLERTVDDADQVSDRKVGSMLDLIRIHSAEELVNLGLVERSRDISRSYETGNSRGISNDIPRVISHDHVHEDISRIDPLLFFDSLPCLDLDLLLARNDDIENLVFHAQRFDSLLEVSENGILISGICMDRVPISLACCLLFCHIVVCFFAKKFRY